MLSICFIKGFIYCGGGSRRFMMHVDGRVTSVRSGPQPAEAWIYEIHKKFKTRLNGTTSTA